MLKILFKNGKETECKGIVKFHNGSQPALCNYDLHIEGRKDNDFFNLKLVYDTETEESVCFTLCSYGFYKGIDKYKELYKKSIRELKLEKLFKKEIEIFQQHVDFNDEDELAQWLLFCEDKIINIFKIR